MSFNLNLAQEDLDGEVIDRKRRRKSQRRKDNGKSDIIFPKKLQPQL
jgi:hypothetical protein